MKNDKISYKEFDSFTVSAEKGEHHVDFVIYKGTDISENLEFQKKQGITPPEITQKPIFIGGVKWDGCSNWGAPNKEQYYTHFLHFCSIVEITAFGKMLPELYKWASEILNENEILT